MAENSKIQWTKVEAKDPLLKTKTMLRNGKKSLFVITQDRKGGDLDNFPSDLQIRELP